MLVKSACGCIALKDKVDGERHVVIRACDSDEDIGIGFRVLKEPFTPVDQETTMALMKQLKDLACKGHQYETLAYDFKRLLFTSKEEDQ